VKFLAERKSNAPVLRFSPDDRAQLPAALDRREDALGVVVRDADGQSLAYVYSGEKPSDAPIANVLTEDEARRMASNFAKLPELLGGN